MLQVRTKPAAPAVAKNFSWPAPYGMNLVDTATELEPMDCLSAVNMLRGQYGLKTRSGYREWVTGLGASVRSILPFQGSASSNDKIFAAIQTGIYDCSTSTSTPGAAVYTFGTSDATSGYCEAVNWTTDAGGHFMLLADETNGYITYAEAGATWYKPVVGDFTPSSGSFDPATVRNITAWKKRIWFTTASSSLAWYTDVDAYKGNVYPFDFGPQFRHGGTLVGIWSLSVNGGLGIDDYLVALSTSGDVVVFQGFDPSSAATFILRDVWYVGQVPAGRRFVTSFGGDALVLGSLGVLPLSKLLSGALTQSEDSYASRKISPVLSQQLTTYLTTRGWEMEIHPEDKALIVLVPYSTTTPSDQWMMSLHAGAWTKASGLAMTTMKAWKTKLYFGTSGGKLCINDGDVDNNQLSGSTNAIAIQWSLLTGFSKLGTASNKRIKQIRPRFRTEGTSPQYSVNARWDLDTSDITNIVYSGTFASSAAVWDSAIWDAATWAAGIGTAGDWKGATGTGTYAALALAGASIGRTTLASFEIFYDVGGLAL